MVSKKTHLHKAKSILAINGGKKLVTIKKPHFVWPPKATKEEKYHLAKQRDDDISIKGRSGPIKELEDEFLKYLDGKRKFAITYNSGTSALLAAYFAIGIEEGDEIIAPALTYHAAISSVYFLKANPILVDIDPKTFCIDSKKIEQAVTKRTKAITVVHQWGHPADMDAILKIARRHNLKIIEDCSHAHGSKYKGKKVGLFGDIAVFSLQANKILFAGEGGILVVNSSELHDRATLLGHYRDRSNEEIKDKFLQQFWVTGYGLKLRMSPYNAVTALHALKKLDQRIKERKKCLLYLSNKLSKFLELTPPYIAPYANMGAWYGYRVLYDPKKFHNIPIDKYVSALAAEGVEVKLSDTPSFSTLPLFSIKEDRMYKNRKDKKTYSVGQFPAAEYIGLNAFKFPTFTDWFESKEIIDQYFKTFKKIHENYNELLEK
ncbi:DegT/DnrJ/EryC1/StrS family aminotransferase [Candidatus Parcubacteria bacterium]|nr:MAG: DegT/DnrJ/EryC1/StrS family aminotransferase [Candidatus Parcubacteria bacterium]